MRMKVRHIGVFVLALNLGLVASTPAATISFWPMEGTGTADVGAIIPDVIGNNDGTVVNEALEYVPGPTATTTALRFQSDTQDKVDVPDDPSLHFDLGGDSFTMEAVFRVDAEALGTGRGAPWGKNGAAGADSQYWVRVLGGSDGVIQALVRGDGGDGPGGVLPPERIGSTSGSVTDGNWHHFAMVYEDGTSQVDLFLDYALDGSIAVDSGDGVIGDNPDGLIIGGFTSSSREFPGDIAAMRFSDTALSVGEFLPIPEPASIVLLALGVCGLLGLTRRGRE